MYSRNDQIRYQRRTYCDCPAGQERRALAEEATERQNWREQAEQIVIQAGLNHGIYEHYRFSTWENSRQQADAKRVFDLVNQYVDTVQTTGPNWAYLWGGYGLGKTHLAVAAVRKIAAIHLWQPHVVIWPELCQTTQESWRANNGVTEAGLWGQARSAQILLIDDLDKTATNEWAMGKLYALINHRCTRQKPTIITANHALTRLRHAWQSSDKEHVRDTGMAVLSRIGGQLAMDVNFTGEDQRWT